jgi:MFS family permease
LRHRNFRLYLAGMGVSLAGTWMQQLALGWLVYRLTHSEWMLGLTAFCANVPVLLFSPLGGIAADRYSRRKMVMAAQTVAMLQACALAVLTYSGLIRPWHILTLALLLGLAGAFDIPGRQALFVHLVGKQDLLNAISLNSATFNAARIVGPSFGGWVVARFGEGACFAANAASFLAVIGSLAAMDVKEPPPQATSEPVTARLREGFRYVWSKPGVRTVMFAVGLTSVGAAPLSALAPMFAGDIFHLGPGGLGLISAAFGAGAVLGTLSLAHGTRPRSLPRVLVVSSFSLGVALAAYAWSPDFRMSLALTVVAGLSVMRQNAASNTTIQLNVDEGYRGRVMGIYSTAVIGMIPVGSLAAGGLAHMLGSRMATFLGALAALLSCFLLVSGRTHLRRWLDPKES